MNSSERIKHIKEISKELSKEEWSPLELTLQKFDLPYNYLPDIDKESYVMEMCGLASDQALLDLAKHLGVASQLEADNEPEFWAEGEARVFLSHLATNKEKTSELRACLSDYGISAFVAHEDIEPTKQWQTEIESAFNSMDALVALLTPGFNESNWCDQEVGVAIGRQLPIIAVRQGLDPYGFIGKYQAVQGAGKTPQQLADEIFHLFLPKSIIGPKIANWLVDQFCASNSYERSKKLIELIKKSPFINSNHVAKMKKANKNNSQVYQAWGVPNEIKNLADRIES